MAIARVAPSKLKKNGKPKLSQEEHLSLDERINVKLLVKISNSHAEWCGFYGLVCVSCSCGLPNSERKQNGRK